MTLIDDFKKVLLLSWSVRLSMLSAVAGGLAEFQQELPGIQSFVPAHWLGPISIACALGATVARVIRQDIHEARHE